jgi:tetratricopeptide (TPR) repeat protein
MLARSSYLREKFPEATAFARRNFEMAEGYGLEDQAEAEMWWARYRAESGEAAQALVQLREAIPRVRDFYRHGYLVAYYAEPAARILNKTGNFAEAVQFATQALHELQACQMPENHPLTAASLVDLGEARCGLNRSREGVPALEKAVGIYQQLGPAYTALADRAGKVLMQAKAR